MATMIEAQISESMRRQDYTASFLAGLCGLSQAKISQGLNGLRPFSGPGSYPNSRSSKTIGEISRTTTTGPGPLAEPSAD